MIPAPRTLTKAQWQASNGPDYVSVWAWRQQMVARFRTDPRLIVGMEAYYKAAPWDFVNHWVVTYDPRRTDPGTTAYVPLIMFQRQEEFVRLLHQALLSSASVLVDKSRDMGVTWLACAFSVWLWRFWPGSAVGWGSRKAELVDKIGDPDSIFEKMRIILRWLPKELLPRGFDINDIRCASQMKIMNAEHGSSIVGEAGDNIGRGGRKLIFFKDESSHYEHPEMIEAALTSNTNIQVDISTVNGPATIFQRKRDAGRVWVPGADLAQDLVNVFIFDRSDHPMKTDEWYETARRKALSEGLGHLFAQEVDRDPSAAIVGTIIRAEWVRAAVGAAERLGIKETGMWGAGLDVADSGPDLNALAIRRGITLKVVLNWGDCRGDETARRVIDIVEEYAPIEVQYDCIGVGASVKSEIGRLEDDRVLPRGVRFVQWNAAAKPLMPEGRVVEDDEDSPLNQDYFHNLKAQGWWQLARRFERTWRALNDLDFKYDPDNLISIDPGIPLLHQLIKELTQPVMSKTAAALKQVVDKVPDGQRSPNLADCVMQAFWPADTKRPMVIHPDVMRNVRRRGEMRRRLVASGYGYV